MFRIIQRHGKTNCTQACFFACNLFLLCFVTFVNIGTGYVQSTRLDAPPYHWWPCVCCRLPRVEPWKGLPATIIIAESFTRIMGSTAGNVYSTIVAVVSCSITLWILVGRPEFPTAADAGAAYRSRSAS